MRSKVNLRRGTCTRRFRLVLKTPETRGVKVKILCQASCSQDLKCVLKFTVSSSPKTD